MNRYPPISPRRKHSNSGVIPGFLKPAKPNNRPISEMTVRELQDRFTLNKGILDSPNANTSSFGQRVTAEQAAIESRLIELQGVETINTGLRKTYLTGDDDMAVDLPPDPPTSRTLEAKRKALAQFAWTTTVGTTAKIGMDEAMELERAAFLRDKERLQRLEEKRQKGLGGSANGQPLTKEEREARIWAFMNHRPTESDLEDEDDSDDEDPANWFEDDQDDGRKEQDIIEPDEEDYSDIIRVDASRIQYSTFYEPRDED